MATLAEKIEEARKCCRESIYRKREDAREFLNKMFDGTWKEFVIKRDRTTGRFTGKKVCCKGFPA